MTPPARFLFLDDETLILTALGRMVRDLRVVSFATTDPSEAWRIIETEGIDVVFCDLIMPTCDGVAFLAEVSRRAPSAIRVLLSGYSDPAFAARTIGEGKADRVVDKPWDYAALKELFQRLAAEAVARRGASAPGPS